MRNDNYQVNGNEVELFKRAYQQRLPVMLTGPTGCGKSTSLYTFLSMLNTMERRIVTVEDPVEHKLSGVMQIAVKLEINLTFATALRSILRGDPNVVMIGEMRDGVSFTAAMSAADTGHLVLSTIHTTNAAQSVGRILDFFKPDERDQIRRQLAATLQADQSDDAPAPSAGSA